METELQSLETSCSRSMSRCASNISIRVDDPDIKYTSLKDVLSPTTPDSSTTTVVSPSIHNFNPSTILIKNQLVKHAASAYLQSAAIMAAREQNWLTRMWWQIRLQGVLNSSWHECVRDPVGFCIGLVMRTIRRMVDCAASHVVVVRSCSSH